MSTHDFRSRPLDERGNIVAQAGTLPSASVTFDGRNNRVVIDGENPLGDVQIRFRGNNGEVVVGPVPEDGHLSLRLDVADGATVWIGKGVTSEKALTMTTAPGARVTVGDDSHFGPGVTIVAEDSRGLGPSTDEDRNNVAVGQHVWIMQGTEIRAGARIGDGAVLELVPLVDDAVPGGQLVRGLPATPVRDVTWNRDSLRS